MIENKAYFSKELKLHFRFCEGGVIFEDKVTYTTEEMELIKASNIPVETIHFAKLYFEGTIISDEDLKKLNETYADKGSDLHKAVEYASKLMKSKVDGRGAIYKAASKFNISASAIGAELGRRSKK